MALSLRASTRTGWWKLLAAIIVVLLTFANVANWTVEQTREPKNRDDRAIVPLFVQVVPNRSEKLADINVFISLDERWLSFGELHVSVAVNVDIDTPEDAVEIWLPKGAEVLDVTYPDYSFVEAPEGQTRSLRISPEGTVRADPRANSGFETFARNFVYGDVGGAPYGKILVMDYAMPFPSVQMVGLDRRELLVAWDPALGHGLSVHGKEEPREVLVSFCKTCLDATSSEAAGIVDSSQENIESTTIEYGAQKKLVATFVNRRWRRTVFGPASTVGGLFLASLIGLSILKPLWRRRQLTLPAKLEKKKDSAARSTSLAPRLTSTPWKKGSK